MSVRWADLYRWSLVEVEFGVPKKDVEDDLDCVDIEKRYIYGINSNNEFSYKHMAIVLSKNIRNSTIVVAPLTQYKYGDNENISRVVLEKEKYGYFLYKDTSILLDNLITIERKTRIRKIIKSRIPEPLRKKIKRAMFNSYK